MLEFVLALLRCAEFLAPLRLDLWEAQVRPTASSPSSRRGTR